MFDRSLSPTTLASLGLVAAGVEVEADTLSTQAIALVSQTTLARKGTDDPLTHLEAVRCVAHLRGHAEALIKLLDLLDGQLDSEESEENAQRAAAPAPTPLSSAA